MLLELLLVLFLLLLSFLLCLLLSLHGQLTALRPLPLHPSVLEPHLYLSLGEVERDGNLVAAESSEVVGVLELGLQLPNLVLREGCALLPRLAQEVGLDRFLCGVGSVGGEVSAVVRDERAQ